MIVVRGTAALPQGVPSVVTVGSFDGVHQGHREIIHRVVDAAAKRGERSVVVTFDPLPKSVLRPGSDEALVLTPIDERVRLIEALGVDAAAILPFTKEFSQLSAQEFIAQYVVGDAGARHLVVGYDHHFGREREGGLSHLQELGGPLHFSVERVEAREVDGVTVSSSAIRQLLLKGDVMAAARLLGYQYSVTGRVETGDRRGATLGFPTANLAMVRPEKVVPGRGVYAVRAEIQGAMLNGMMNIGVRPTISAGLRETKEVHLFGFEGELYGSLVRVEFRERLRDERRFGSLDELVRQLHMDRRMAQMALAGL